MKRHLFIACFLPLVLILVWCGWMIYQFEGPPARQVFIHDLNSLQVGMTADEVERVMGHYIKGVGAAYLSGKDRMHATGVMTYRWNAKDARYDADIGQISIVNGRVVKVEFLPD